MTVAFATIMLVGLSAQAQGTLNFNWTQDKNGNTGTILMTPSSTNSQFPTTAIDLSTSYRIEFSLNDTNLSVARQIVSRPDLGSGAAYYAGPAFVANGGTTVNFYAWLNPTAQAGSSESIYNILINGIAIPQTITANSNNPVSQFQYISSAPIVDIKFDYLINAVSDTSETGIGISMPSPVPEPASLSIGAMALVTGWLYRKRK